MEASSMAERFREAFDPNEWRQAKLYSSAGKIDITDADAAGFDAVVQEAHGKHHDLSVEWEEIGSPRVLRASCTCPRFLEGHLCKHIAAGLLEADRERLKHLPAGPLTVVPDFGEDDYWEWEDPDPSYLYDDDLVPTIFVDRAHRIGQTQRVFAYRLIARDTVEEKILQLQGEKRKLAEAIITADNSLISQLTADDLQLLLS